MRGTWAGEQVFGQVVTTRVEAHGTSEQLLHSPAEATTLGLNALFEVAKPVSHAQLSPLYRGFHLGAEWSREVHYGQYYGDWFGHYSARMVTDGRWKLVFNFSDYCELYDFEADPGELHNRFYDPEVGEVRDRYIDLLFAEAERLGDRQLRLFRLD